MKIFVFNSCPVTSFFGYFGFSFIMSMCFFSCFLCFFFLFSLFFFACLFFKDREKEFMELNGWRKSWRILKRQNHNENKIVLKMCFQLNKRGKSVKKNPSILAQDLNKSFEP